MKRIFSLLICLLVLKAIHAQDTLPNFTLAERGNKVIISWVNPYPNCVQLNVQRSYDSLRYFQTVFSSLSPQLPQNGFSETKMPTNRIFYRLFYVLEGGAYFFTKSHRLGSNYELDKSLSLYGIGNGAATIKIKTRDNLFAEMVPARFRVFRDSVMQNTRDTLYAINNETVMYLPYMGKDMFRASMYVYTMRDGITISLPNTAGKKYSIKFFEEDGTHLFDIKHVKESQLILDKANFMHAGWFLFELYEDDKLKEKNKFFLSKEF